MRKEFINNGNIKKLLDLALAHPDFPVVVKIDNKILNSEHDLWSVCFISSVVADKMLVNPINEEEVFFKSETRQEDLGAMDKIESFANSSWKDVIVIALDA